MGIGNGAMKQGRTRRQIEREADGCALAMFLELTGGKPRPEWWYKWYLCERHGGAPLVHDAMPPGQIAYWDGEDIVLDAHAPIHDIIAALPEELAHRLSGRDAPRFELLNYFLRCAEVADRAAFQEMVGQRVAELFAATTSASQAAAPH